MLVRLAKEIVVFRYLKYLQAQVKLPIAWKAGCILELTCSWGKWEKRVGKTSFIEMHCIFLVKTDQKTDKSIKQDRVPVFFQFSQNLFMTTYWRYFVQIE